MATGISVVGFFFVLMPFLIVAFIAFIIFLFIRLIERQREGARLSREEAARLEQLAVLLQKMEERIANLETILHAGERGGEHEKEGKQ